MTECVDSFIIMFKIFIFYLIIYNIISNQLIGILLSTDLAYDKSVFF